MTDRTPMITVSIHELVVGMEVMKYDGEVGKITNIWMHNCPSLIEVKFVRDGYEWTAFYRADGYDAFWNAQPDWFITLA
jgi:hypothetical protein